MDIPLDFQQFFALAVATCGLVIGLTLAARKLLGADDDTAPHA